MLAIMRHSLLETVEIMAADLGVEIEFISDAVIIHADALIGNQHDGAKDCGPYCISCRRWEAINSWADETIGTAVDVEVTGQRTRKVARASFAPAEILVAELKRHGWPDKATRAR